jgi:hypothetical protein
MNSSSTPAFFSSRKKMIATTSTLLLLVGVAANGAGNLNNSDSGYLMCINTKTKVVTHPGTTKCVKGTTPLVVSAKGQLGATGLTGAAGLNGQDGKDGKTLWNGIKDPEIAWGAAGDMYINATTQTLFGPKNLDGSWPAGVSMVGPRGNQGLVGLTGAMGPQGPGGSGPAGPAGASGLPGAAGLRGASGEDGSDGQGPVYFRKVEGEAVTEAGSIVMAFSLPAGSYLLTYSGIAVSTDGNTHFVDCAINADPTLFFTSVVVGGVGGLPNTNRIWLQETNTLNSFGTMVVVCKSAHTVPTDPDAPDAPLHVFMLGQTFSALRVSEVVDRS